MPETSKQEDSSKEQYPVRKVCSYCKRDMGDPGFTSSTEGEISHGICPECAKKIKEEFAKELEQFKKDQEN